MLLLLLGGVYAFYDLVMIKRTTITEKNTETQTLAQMSELPDHLSLNDKIEQRVKAIFASIEYDIILKELKLGQNSLELKGIFLKEDTYLKSLKPKLDLLYKTTEYMVLNNEKKVNIESSLVSKDEIELSNIIYKTNTKEYITDELIPIERVSEQLKILLPENSILKLISSTDLGIYKYNYIVNILVKEPAQFFELIDVLNNELYSINIAYPLSMIRTESGIEIEFNLAFNQLK